MGKPPLRAVSDEERAAEQPATILAAAEVSERALLVALRSKIATDLDSGAVPAHAIARLVTELRDVDQRIRAIDATARQDRSPIASTNDEAWNSSAI